MIQKVLISGALVLGATAANAAFTVTIDQPFQSIALPAVATDIIFTGTITKDELGGGSASTTINFPGLPGDIDFLPSAVNGAYFAWTTDPTTNPFVGELFRVNVPPTSQLGLHDSNSISPTGLASVRFTYQGVTGANYSSDFLPFSVNITPVPEPATMAILGLGALGMLKRRKRS